MRVLELDNLLHSFVVPEDPTLLVYDYVKVMAEIATYVGQRDPSLRALFIGGGGYTMPRYLEAVYPRGTSEVIEIDPEVTRVAFEYLGLQPDTRIVTYNEDARIAVPKLPSGQYDLVVGDAFHDVSIPYHLTTREFNDEVAALLKDDGIYAVNVIDKLHSGKFLRSYVGTLRRTFPYVYVIGDDPAASWEEDRVGTFVVVASSQPLSPTDLERTNAEAGRGELFANFMPEDTFRSWLNASGRMLLTDNHAPVDNLMAPIFLALAGSDQAGDAARHSEAGAELQAQGRTEEAIAEYDEAIRLDPTFAEAYTNRGAAYDSLGRPDRAILDYDEAIRFDPQDSVAYFNRGLSYLELGQFQQAIEDLGEAIRLEPWDAAAYAGRALAHAALGEDARAEENFDSAVELGFDPTLLRELIDERREQR